MRTAAKAFITILSELFTAAAAFGLVYVVTTGVSFHG